MLRSMCHYLRSRYSRHRCGIDTADIQHIRADLRFRLAIVEYAYFGRSGRRVARCIEELKELLGDKGVSRYLRSLDEDLRTQFVERFQGSRADKDSRDRSKPGQPVDDGALAANVVPISRAARTTDEREQTPPAEDDSPRSGGKTT